MAGRRGRAGGPGGGARIQTVRATRLRLTTGTAALVALAGAAAFAVTTEGRLARLADALAALALLLLGLGLLRRRPSLVPWAILSCAGSYLAVRSGNATVDGWAAAVGTLLLLAAELASWSIDQDARIVVERELVVRRTLILAALALAALVVDFLLLATSAVSSSPGVLLAIVGTVSAVAAVGFVLRLLRPGSQAPGPLQ
jgi:hypothetical protein